MKNKTDIILDAIKEALGGHVKYFHIKSSSILVDDDDHFATLVAFTPRDDIETEDGKVQGEPQLLEFVLYEGDEPSLIVGEDTDTGISFGSIYSCLYWCEVIKPIREAE